MRLAWNTGEAARVPVAASDNTEANIPTERDRVLRRIDEIRSTLRATNSLDVIEALLQALADCEQRLAELDGRPDGATPAPA